MVRSRGGPGEANTLPTAGFSDLFFFPAGRISSLIPFKMVIRLGDWGSKSSYAQAPFNEFSRDCRGGNVILFIFLTWGQRRL